MRRGIEDQLSFPATYRLVRSRRRRRTIELSLDASGGVIVAAPMQTPHHEIDAFVQRKARWIDETMRTARERADHLRRDFVSGESFPYQGQSLELRVFEAGDAGVDLVGTALEVRVQAHLRGDERRSAVVESLEAWYKARATETFLERIEVFAPPVGVHPTGVRVRDQKTRWGSCGRDGTLYFSWRLVMAPLTVIDYLVVHELCHLRRQDHGRAFWSVVAGVLPDYEERRAKLRRDGWRYRLW